MSDTMSGIHPFVIRDPSAPRKSWIHRMFCDPTSAIHRYLFMFLLCFGNIGDYAMYETPAALEDHFLKDLRISETSYMGFYSSYQWTSTIFNVVGGYLVDKFFNLGTSFATLAFGLTLCQVAFAMGAFWDSYWVMYVSRALLGVVDSPFGVVVSGLSVKWFQGKELNLMFALKSSLGRLGSVINMYTMEPVYGYFRNYFTGYKCIGLTLMTVAGLCLICAIAALYVAYLDVTADKKLNKPKPSNKSKDVTLSGILKFKSAYWLITITTGIYSITIYPFIGLAKVFFESKYNLDPAAANSINGLPFIISAVMLPLVGICIDKVGRNLLWMMCGLILILCSHMSFAFLEVSPYFGACLIGVGYSLVVTVMYPLVSEVIEERYLASAYGIMATFASLIQAGLTSLTGYIADNYGYFLLEIFFSGCSCLALIFGIILMLINNLQSGSLNNSRKNKPRPSIVSPNTE